MTNQNGFTWFAKWPTLIFLYIRIYSTDYMKQVIAVANSPASYTSHMVHLLLQIVATIHVVECYDVILTLTYHLQICVVCLYYCL